MASRFCAALLVTAFVGSALAEWDPTTRTYDTTGYIKMSATESGSVSSFNTGANWEDGNAPKKGEKYYQPSGMQMRILKDAASTPFAGDILAAAGSFSGPCSTVSIPTLHLLSGWVYYVFLNSVTMYDSDITVYQTGKNNNGISTFHFGVENSRSTGNGMQFSNVTLVGDPDTRVDFSVERTNSVGYMTFKANTDLSAFYGRFRSYATAFARSKYTKPEWESHGGFRFGTLASSDLPCSFELGTNEVFDLTLDSVTTGLSVSNLVLHKNAQIYTFAGESGTRTLSVKDRFVHNEGAIRMAMSALPTFSGSTGTPHVAWADLVPLRVKVAEGDTAETPAFSLTDFELPEVTTKFGLPRFQWTVERADGWDAIRGIDQAVVTLQAPESDPSDVCSLTNAQVWSDGELPHAGADYFMISGVRVLSSPTLWGPNNENRDTTPGRPNPTYHFPGDALVCVGANLQFSTDLKGLSCDRLTLVEGSQIATYATPLEVFVNGDRPVEMLKNPGGNYYTTFFVYNNSSVRLRAPLVGDGKLRCLYRGNKQKPGFVMFDEPSPGYSGKILLCCNYFDQVNHAQYTPSETTRVEVVVGNALALGGARASYDWDALRIRDCSLLKITNTVDFAETNRGVFVDNVACLRVTEGKTATFRAPFTFGGELRKDGAGTLALGSTVAPRYAYRTDVTKDTFAFFEGPQATTNVLYVKEGALQVLTTNAVDGLAIRFANGTQLALDYSDETIRANGLYDTAWATPLAFDDAETKVTVTPVGVPLGTEDFSMTVATVPEGQGASACAQLKAAPRSGFRGKLTVSEPVDGKEQITLSYAKVGALIFFR